MCRLTRPAVAAAVLAAAGLSAPVRAADVDPLLPADTEVVMAVNVRQVLGSEVVRKYLGGQLDQAMAGQDAKQMMARLRLDPRKDIDRVTFGLWGKDAKDMSGLAVARGNFDPQKLFAAAQQAAKGAADGGPRVEVVEAGDYKLVKFTPEKEDQKPVYLAVASGTAVVAGTDKKLVTDALAAAPTEPRVKKELADLVRAQDAQASVFLCGLTKGKVELPPGLTLPNVDAKQLAAQLEAMRSVAMTVRVTSDVGLEVAMAMADADAADDFAATVDQLLGVAKVFLPVIAGNMPQAKPVVDDVVKSLKSKVADKAVTVVVGVSSGALAKVAEAAPAGRGGDDDKDKE